MAGRDPFPDQAAASADPAGERSPATHSSLHDIAILMALPAHWLGHEPDDIVSDLAGVLVSLLRLESVYVRFSDPANGMVLEHWRPQGPTVPEAFASILSATPIASSDGVATLHGPVATGAVRVTRMHTVLPDDEELVLASASRDDFPTESELQLLQITVGQATISVRAARMLTLERTARLAAETALEERNHLLAAIADELAETSTALRDRAADARFLAGDATPHQSHAQPGLAEGQIPATQTPSQNAMANSKQSLTFALASPLTRRETEVLGLLAQGLSNKEIAAELWLSDRTVERHITGLYAKIGVRSRTGAALFALQQGRPPSNGSRD